MNQNIQNRAVRPHRYVFVNSNNSSSEGHMGSVPVNAVSNLTPTHKLSKFFKNLLELERNQGRYTESVAIIQKYINKEINIDELGNQLKGNAAKASLPESLMKSLNSHIGDLRREMFYGRVKIEGINPPPEIVLESTPTIVSTSSVTPTVTGAGTLRVTQPQLLIHQAQQQIVAQAQVPRSSVIRATQRPQTFPRSAVALSVTPNSLSNQRNIAPQALIRPPLAASLIKQEESHIESKSNENISAPQPTIHLVQQSSSSNNHGLITTSSAAAPPPTLSTTTSISSTPSQPTSHITLPSNIINISNYRSKITPLLSEYNMTLSDDATTYLAEALETFSQNLLEQAAMYACHRHEMFVNNPFYKKIDDVKSQMQILQQMDAEQRLSEEERQKQELIRQSKSRSKADSQEQQRIKDRVRQMQEHERSNEEYSRANQTALKAIGGMTTKRRWSAMEGEGGGDDENSNQSGGKRILGENGGGASYNVLNPSYVLQHGAASGTNVAGGISGVSLPNTLSGLVSNTAAGGMSSGNMTSAPNAAASSSAPNSNTSLVAARYRNKRIGLRDFQNVLDKNHKFQIFKTYKKMFSYGSRF